MLLSLSVHLLILFDRSVALCIFLGCIISFDIFCFFHFRISAWLNLNPFWWTEKVCFIWFYHNFFNLELNFSLVSILYCFLLNFRLLLFNMHNQLNNIIMLIKQIFCMKGKNTRILIFLSFFTLMQMRLILKSLIC